MQTIAVKPQYLTAVQVKPENISELADMLSSWHRVEFCYNHQGVVSGTGERKFGVSADNSDCYLYWHEGDWLVKAGGEPENFFVVTAAQFPLLFDKVGADD